MAIAFTTLKELARERLQEKRRALLRAISETLFETLNRMPAEVDRFDQIFDQITALVLADVEPPARRELAERMADLEKAPRRTLVRLAGGEIAVAEPVLTRSPMLDDDDLEPIAREQTQDHLLAIARRKSLSERLTDVLVVRGNDDVADTLTTNGGAHFSANGYAKLAHRATANEAILNHLLMRCDLPEAIASEMLPVLSASIQVKIESLRADVGPGAARTLAGEARHLLAARLHASARPALPLPALKDLIDRGALLFNEAVIELADADRLVDLAALIGLRLGLRSETFVRNLFAAGEEALMQICRAAGLDVNAFSAVLRMRTRRRRGAGIDPAHLLKHYLRIPRDVAERDERG